MCIAVILNQTHPFLAQFNLWILMFQNGHPLPYFYGYYTKCCTLKGCNILPVVQIGALMSLLEISTKLPPFLPFTKIFPFL